MIESCTLPPGYVAPTALAKIRRRVPLFHSGPSCFIVVRVETLLIPDRDVRALLPMRECIEVMAHALRSVAEEKSILPLRTVIRLPDTPNAFACMPAVFGAGPSAALGAKVITVFPGNDATPYDSHIGVVLLFDAGNGALSAIAEAGADPPHCSGLA